MVATEVLTPERRVQPLPQLRRLIAQLQEGLVEVRDDVLAERLSDDRLVMVVVHDGGEVVATATIAVLTVAALGRVGHVDDVVVDEVHRGKGLGRVLMEAVHAEARRLGLRHLDLTSRPAREAANALYVSLGYDLRPTNPYRLRL